ncbi:MAG TPA: glycoside-pentoside-hexuronide (GPH):cation symporter [Patescibacteria group bacterium]|nr:glycoside-pentoside-hexuronide (GPH):cation symporter [Patescibacteria group bacterium]
MEKTSKLERLSYGGFFAGQNLILTLTLQFLLIFYTDVVMLPANIIVALFLVARIWDAVNDPMMGIIVDKVNLKGGKFKPWVNGVVILLPLMTIFLFQNPAESMHAKITYAFITYIIWGMIYTLGDIPAFALSTVMTDNPDERVKIIMIGRLLGGLGALIGVILMTPFKVMLGWSNAVLVLSIIAFFMMVFVRKLTVERILYDRPAFASITTIIKSVSGNKYLIIFYSVVIFTNLTNTSSGTVVHFVKYNLGNEMLIPVLSLAAASTSIFMPLILPKLIFRFGKRNLFMGLMGISIISSVLFYFIGYSNIVVVFIFIALKFLALNLPVLMMGMFSTDCLEYGYYRHGTRNEGTVFSIQTFSIKLTLAMQGAIGAYALGKANYVANAVQSQETLMELWRMTTLYPIFGQIIAVVLFYFFYHLSEAEVANMMEENRGA